MKRVVWVGVLLASLVWPWLGMPGAVQPANAQEQQLVATLEVLDAGVEMKRAGTEVWLPVRVEGLVSEGDAIRTDATGSALITFFEDGTSAELQPESEVVITRFTGNDERFTLEFEVLAGITVQQFQRLLDPASTYRVITPGIDMVVRGTDFAVRVEDTGRSALLTFEGRVDADDTPVEGGFGVRAAADGPLSPVVPATTFDELDTALDGCPASATIDSDVQLNVRRGPSLDNDILTTLPPPDINLVLGVTESGEWYRISLGEETFGWVSAELVAPDEACPLLRQFSDDYVEGAE